MIKPAVAPSKIKKINGTDFSDEVDLLAVEEPLEIRIGFGTSSNRMQKNISVTMRTPGNDFELAIGFLFTEGIIHAYSDVLSIKYCSDLNTVDHHENVVRVELVENLDFDVSKLERNFYTTSSCGVCGKASIEAIKTGCVIQKSDESIKFSSALIYQLPDILRKQQSVFEYTGGLHASALFDLNGNLNLTREDVGRHNALDKLIGAALGLGLLPLNKYLLLLSGRASFELIQKAAMAGIKMIAAVGAPSSLAVETAKEFDITLIGFLNDKRFNIYSGENRIQLLK